MEESNQELENFRQQWRAEVTARSQSDGNKIAPAKAPRRPPPTSSLSVKKVLGIVKETDDDVEPPKISELGSHHDVERQYAESSKSGAKEPQSALEHYEKAVEREAQGILGDSLDLYRKAFKMDDTVDQKYKNKHFPPSSFISKLPSSNPSNASVTVPNTAHHSLHGPPQPIKELLASFATLKIEPTPPFIEGTPPPPCPLADLPDEILVQVLETVAVADISSFTRLAQVCKKLAYLVSTEEQIWKRVCLGSEVGFGGMHYNWQTDVLGGPLNDDTPESDDDGNILDKTPPLTKEETTEVLYLSAYSASWHLMFRRRPRIRFNGCYISTVTYMRPGQASSMQSTWSSPVHIVTYFRYLRFFRDGTVISLLSTTEPADVVHCLTKELAATHRNGASPHLPSIVMQYALRGRWRLSTAEDSPEADLKDAEGDVFIETEGANLRYMYRMQVSLRNAGKGAKNNKLVWKGFWNYNRLTDDAGEFPLRNDKAFFWSRVKSYGDGA